MANPQAVINKKGPIAAQNQHLGRTITGPLQPVPVSDHAQEAAIRVTAVEFILDGVLIPTQDAVYSPATKVTHLELGPYIVRTQDAARGLATSITGVDLRSIRVYADAPHDAVFSDMPTVLGAELRTVVVQGGVSPDTARSLPTTVLDITLGN